MWLFVMFDLPVDTKAARKAYAQFRKELLKDGFHMLQYSVYARVCASQEAVAVHMRRVQNALPPDGEVRCLLVTDKQFGRQRIFHGRMRRPPEPRLRQLQLY